MGSIKTGFAPQFLALLRAKIKGYARFSHCASFAEPLRRPRYAARGQTRVRRIFRGPKSSRHGSTCVDLRRRKRFFWSGCACAFSASRAFPDTVVSPVSPSSRASGPLRARASAKQVKCGDENFGRSRGLGCDSRASSIPVIRVITWRRAIQRNAA